MDTHEGVVPTGIQRRGDRFYMQNGLVKEDKYLLRYRQTEKYLNKCRKMYSSFLNKEKGTEALLIKKGDSFSKDTEKGAHFLKYKGKGSIHVDTE